MTTIKWAIFGALSRPKVPNGMIFSELADYLAVSRQSLHGVLKRLEQEHDVERVMDSQDRRARRVRLTPKGKTLWTAIQPRIHAFYEQALGGLSFDDEVALVHFLNRLDEGIAKVEVIPPVIPGELPSAPKAFEPPASPSSQR